MLFSSTPRGKKAMIPSRSRASGRSSRNIKDESDSFIVVSRLGLKNVRPSPVPIAVLSNYRE